MGKDKENKKEKKERKREKWKDEEVESTRKWRKIGEDERQREKCKSTQVLGRFYIKDDTRKKQSDVMKYSSNPLRIPSFPLFFLPSIPIYLAL